MKLGIDGCEDLSGRGAFVHSDVEGMAAGRSGESASSITQSCKKIGRYNYLETSSNSVDFGKISKIKADFGSNKLT